MMSDVVNLDLGTLNLYPALIKAYDKNSRGDWRGSRASIISLRSFSMALNNVIEIDSDDEDELEESVVLNVLILNVVTSIGKSILSIYKDDVALMKKVGFLILKCILKYFLF